MVGFPKDITKDQLIGLAIGLGARDISGWSDSEEELSRTAECPASTLIARVRSSIRSGDDPLGDLFSALFSPEQRRPMGAVYTPQPIVDAMLRWAKVRSRPERIVDAGTGSGRFLCTAAETFKAAKLIGFESDPVAALLARANLSTKDLAERSEVSLNDYRAAELGPISGQTLFLGNPPYVRHHLINQKWKMWLTTTARELGHSSSGLAGLHVYFFLATARLARPGDVGIFITAAEWLDVNYGELVRNLFLDELGGTDLQIIEPEADPFPGTASTAVISGFRVGETPETVGVRRVLSLSDLGTLTSERRVNRERFQTAARWTPLTRAIHTRRSDFIELGEICRVHRGQVTGANRVWIENRQSINLPSSVLYPTITRAKELFAAGVALTDADPLRCVIDIPPDLTLFDADEKERIQGYLAFAKESGANSGYVATHRRAWWSVGLKSPAPILATYMARRPPAFVRNLVDARHINIAHGLYPRAELSSRVLDRLASFLSVGVSTNQGRTYAGGLTKFEPREMERLQVPNLDLLNDEISVEALLD